MMLKYLMSVVILASLSGCTVSMPLPSAPTSDNTLILEQPLPPAQVTVQVPEQPTPVVNVTVPEAKMPEVNVNASISLNELSEAMAPYAKYDDYVLNRHRISDLLSRVEALEEVSVKQSSGKYGLPASCDTPMSYFLAFRIVPADGTPSNINQLKQLLTYQKMLKDCLGVKR